MRLFISITGLLASMLTPLALAQTPLSTAMQDLQTISGEAMQGREIGSAGSALARAYIIKRLQEIGLKPCGENFVQDFTSQRPRDQVLQGKNILACQPATDAPDAKSLIISAHYDHLGINRGKTYFGADDNASGVAGVLAVAESFKGKKTHHQIVYAFFDGEEQGLLGAFAFIKKALIPTDKIAANLNFDMIARGDKNELFISGTHQNPTFKPLLQSLDGIRGIKLSFDHDRPEQGSNDWTPQSDHYAFFKAGIPHLYFGVEDHADYHKPSDSFEKIKAEFFDGSIEIIVKAAHIIDQQ
ncbi:MAG: M28 family peptidase [Burkholderiales bacterium]|nr:M28 family peptidase [Burkholderiales bacterium]